jgi:Sec-independent protein translocase protein TatA
MGSMKKIIATVAICFVVLGASGLVMAGSEKDDLLMELKNLVERQQKQLDTQASEIAKLKEQMAELTGTQEDVSEKLAAVETEGEKVPVSSGNKHAEVQLYGHINRAVLLADDGNSSKTYFVDNTNSMTRMGIKGKIQATDDFSVGTWIELGLITNPSTLVDQSEEFFFNTDILKRQLDLFLQSKKYGKLSLGYGSTASDGTSEVDLSGTSVVAYSPVADMAGGQFFYDKQNNMLSDVKVLQVFVNMDGMFRQDRIRYDSPIFSGFNIAGSYGSYSMGDIALRYSRNFTGVKLAAALAGARTGDFIPLADNQYNGSLSLLLENGLNATFSGGIRTWGDDNRDDANYWYAKFGYQVKLFTFGQSNLSVDYTRSKNISMDDDTASSFGLAYVQNIKEWGTELYLAYRWYELDREDEEYEDINAVMSGARIKF